MKDYADFGIKCIPLDFRPVYMKNDIQERSDGPIFHVNGAG